MNWKPSGVGAEPKKLAILGILVVLLGVAYWTNSGPDIPPDAVPTPAASTKAGQAPAVASATAPPATRTRVPSSPRVATRAANDDFKPSLRVPDGVDISKVDPTLRLYLLARVREVGDVGGRRSLFEFYTPPPPPPPEVKPIEVEAPKPAEVKPAAEAPKAEPAKPPPPPIPLKFYGYAGDPQAAERRAFFLEGEDIIHLVGENEIINDRYKIIRIGINSAEVEDLQYDNRQTLPIVEMIPL